LETAIAARISTTERAGFKLVNMGVFLVMIVYEELHRRRYPTEVSFKHD
jgi:hypothetical protein